MPIGDNGQMITFAEEMDPDDPFQALAHIRSHKNDTCRIIAARYGHGETAARILELNRNRTKKVTERVHHHRVTRTIHLVVDIHGHPLRHTYQKLKAHQDIIVPGNLQKRSTLHVLAHDTPPIVKDGYAKYDTVDRPGRVGINRFVGYDPVTLDIPIQFEEWVSEDGAGVEDRCALLERFAGRGNFHGAAIGPPAVLRLSVTGAHGGPVPLIPFNYQWTHKNQTAPLYRISGIQWDANPQRSPSGHRLRQTAVVTVRQYTPLVLRERSASRRAAARRG